MLKVHLSNGITDSFDLTDLKQIDNLIYKLKKNDYQFSITALSICHDGSTYSISRPKGYRNIIFHPEYIKPKNNGKIKGGFKITCFADDSKLTIMVHRSNAIKVDLAKIGNQVYSSFIG